MLDNDTKDKLLAMMPDDKEIERMAFNTSESTREFKENVRIMTVFKAQLIKKIKGE